jgi:peptidoglycan/LPS O-acetylase OafA/YrhL
MRPNGPFSRFLLGALGFCAGILLIAVSGDYLSYLIQFLLPALLALGLILRALEPPARKRGWGGEGRLARCLSRPRFIDESKRLRVDSGRVL